MNNEIKEIKEILDKLKDREETYQFCKQYKLSINDWIYEAHYLLDYITNLQQEIEKLNDDKRGMLVQLYKANDEKDKIKQENERLKEDRAYAIGYIKNNYGKFTEIEVEKGAIKEKRYLSDFNIEHLLNILQNGSEEK